MYKKIVGIFVLMLIITAVVPASETLTMTTEHTGIGIMSHQPPTYDTEWRINWNKDSYDIYPLGRSDFGFFSISTS